MKLANNQELRNRSDYQRFNFIVNEIGNVAYGPVQFAIPNEPRIGEKSVNFAENSHIAAATRRGSGGGGGGEGRRRRRRRVADVSASRRRRHSAAAGAERRRRENDAEATAASVENDAAGGRRRQRRRRRAGGAQPIQRRFVFHFTMRFHLKKVHYDKI